ncbi:MAG: SH3 domain-containing protein, partial [Anaerolineales bacterium]
GGGEAGDPNSGNLAVIQQKLNIRSGPGTDFNSIGTLNPLDAVNLTGKDANGTWLRIEFPAGAGPEGRGWINAAFVQANGVENLPIVTDAGVVVGTGTPTTIPLTPIPTIMPAWEDNDSPASPIMNVTFDPTGTQVSIYNGDVSAPEGDEQDWVQFTPYSQTVLLEVSCKGSDLDIEILQNGPAVQQMEAIYCGSKLIIHVQPDQPIKIRFTAHSDGLLNYTSYTLHLKTIP